MKKRMNLTNMLRGWTYRYLTKMGYDDDYFSSDSITIPVQNHLWQISDLKTALKYTIDTEDI